MSSSVSGVTSSNSSSIYGTRNVLSGLATGLDTESMIENAVSGYNTKITSLQQKQTKLTWKQEAYRDITDPMVQFSRKYTSYTSSTNLYSASFFNNAVTTTTNGDNASAVSASGKTYSDVQILGIKSLAAKATYNSTQLSGIDSSNPETLKATITGDDITLSSTMTLSTVSGTLSLNYGSDRSVDISFDDLEIYSDINDLTDAINTKLAAQTLYNSDGDQVAASTMIKASVDGDNIVFSDNQSAGNSVTIGAATGDIASTLSIDTSGDASTITVGSTALNDTSGTLGEYLSGKSLTMTVDGTTKTINLPTYAASGDNTQDTIDFVTALNKTVQGAFGTGVTVSNASSGETLDLKIQGQAGSTISVTSGNISNALGLEDNTTSYLDTSKTLSSILGEDISDSALIINGVTIGTYSSSTTLETILSDINANSEAGVTVKFSKTTNSFLFTSDETGASSGISFGLDADGNAETNDLAYKLFGGADESGSDAELSMEVNGITYSNITRSSNSFNVDGLTINLSDTFGYTTEDETDTDGTVITPAGTFIDGTDPVTFTTSADADTIVDAVTSMVDDLNAIMESVHDAYSTQPLTKSDGSSYDPLTDDDESDMTDSAIEAYEEKAKTGLLFGDSDLSSLYSKLLSAVQSSGTAGSTLRSMGITTSYSDGLTVLSVDEDALRDTLETDPDSVRDAFTSTTGTGGLMTNIKSIMDSYASTTGATKGILIQKAGSTYSSLSLLDNSLQDQVDDLDDQIDKWQDKLSDKIDYYTSLFTKLEELTSQMNSQSSLLSGMLGS